MPGKRHGPPAAPALFLTILMPALLLLMLWGALPVRAATFTVDDTADTRDADRDDGLCADAAGACTLRAAVDQTNALPGHDTIVLPAGVYSLTLAAAGDLEVFDDLTIRGDGAGMTVVDAAWADRVLHLRPGWALTVTGVTLRNGQTADGGSATTRGRGGAVLNERGTLFLGDVILRGNAAAARSAQAGAGGAIYNLEGTVTLSNTLLEDNDAIDVNGGPVLGGALYNDGGALFIYGSAFLGNVSGAREGFIAAGGALYNEAGRVTIDRAYFAFNGTQAIEAAYGGAIHNDGGVVTMTATTLRNNSSYNMDSTSGGPSYGGAIANDAGGRLLLENVTLSQNAASALLLDGDVYAGGLYNAGDARLNNVTLYHNILEDVYNDGGTLTLANSIAAGEDAICANAGEEGAVIDGGYNLLESGGCGILGSGDLLLGPLADNGGPATPLGVIPTHALLNGSPALDAGHPAAPHSVPFACAPVDQRNISRPQDGQGDTLRRCDAGAFEADALPLEGLWVSAVPSTTIGASTRLTAGVAAGANAVYSWDLGDGETATGRTVIHTYAAVDVYTATVTVSNSVSLLTKTVTVSVLDAPIEGPVSVEIGVERVEVGSACSFRVQIAGGTGVSYTWDFGDGHTASGRVVRHTFAAAGEYMVSVTAANGVSEIKATRPVTVVRPAWRAYLPSLMAP